MIEDKLVTEISKLLLKDCLNSINISVMNFHAGFTGFSAYITESENFTVREIPYEEFYKRNADYENSR